MTTNPQQPPAGPELGAASGSACAACESRATAWLTEHLEGWYGDKRTWTKKQKDQWCEYLGVLTLFAKDFHFPTQNSD